MLTFQGEAERDSRLGPGPGGFGPRPTQIAFKAWLSAILQHDKTQFQLLASRRRKPPRGHRFPPRPAAPMPDRPRIQFLADCTHELAGKTVDMEPL